MRRAVFVVALPLLAATSQSQQPRQMPDSVQRRCDSLLRASVVDSERVLVRSLLLRRDGYPLPRNDAGLILQEFGSQLRLPRPMQVPVFSPGPVQTRSLRVLRTDEGNLRRPRLDATYQLVMLRDGTATSIATVRPSLVAGLDSAVLRALSAMSKEKLYPLLADDYAADSIPLTLYLTSGSGGVGTEVPLFASMFPMVPMVDAAPQEPVPAPVFPKEERDLGVEGDVLFQVVVNADGEPELATLEVMHASTRNFAVAAFDVVRQMRWTPAHLHGCTVPQVVNVPVRFTLPVARTDSAEKRKPH
jgi:TonB family protein